jgi:hypothetical protein
MCANILQKTVVLILHPCLRVRKTVNYVIKLILDYNTKEDILTYFSPILKNYTKGVSSVSFYFIKINRKNFNIKDDFFDFFISW